MVSKSFYIPTEEFTDDDDDLPLTVDLATTTISTSDNTAANSEIASIFDETDVSKYNTRFGGKKTPSTRGA